jgi:hypothetical protein
MQDNVTHMFIPTYALSLQVYLTLSQERGQRQIGPPPSRNLLPAKQTHALSGISTYY